MSQRSQIFVGLKAVCRECTNLGKLTRPRAVRPVQNTRKQGRPTRASCDIEF